MKGRSNLILWNSTEYYSERVRKWTNCSIIIWVFCYCASVLTTDKIYKKIQRKQTKHEIWNKRNKFPWTSRCYIFNPLNPELNPICYLLALLAHHFLHVSRIRVKSLTLRLLMFIYIYIYMERLFLMFLDHTQRRSTVGRTRLDEWSAHHRDLYLTTHDTHNRQISMPPVGSEPKISAGKRTEAARLLRSWVRIPPGGMDIYLLWVSCVVR